MSGQTSPEAHLHNQLTDVAYIASIVDSCLLLTPVADLILPLGKLLYRAFE